MENAGPGSRGKEYGVPGDCSVIPTLFFDRSLPFLILFIIIENQKKNLYVGSFNCFSHTIQIGSNWYIYTGVRDLEVACVKANSA